MNELSALSLSLSLRCFDALREKSDARDVATTLLAFLLLRRLVVVVVVKKVVFESEDAWW